MRMCVVRRSLFNFYSLITRKVHASVSEFCASVCVCVCVLRVKIEQMVIDEKWKMVLFPF